MGLPDFSRSTSPTRIRPWSAICEQRGPICSLESDAPEFGAGANTRNRVYGATGNPFNPELTAAGSSGGSAAALALGQLSLATGSDYGGSLRTPSACPGHRWLPAIHRHRAGYQIERLVSCHGVS